MASNMTFHNNTVSLHDLFYQTNLHVLKLVCIELGHDDKIKELQEKFLGKKQKIKALKDKNKPKRAKSGFMFFCDAKRPKLMDQYRKKKKTVNVGEVAKKLGAEWKKLDGKKKSPYMDLAAKDKERYVNAMEKYNAKNMF